MPHDAYGRLSWNVAGHEAGEGRGFGGSFSRGAGAFMGEGLSPVPGCLAELIRNWEFIEMFELLPELLADQKARESMEKHPHQARGCKQVQDIGAWLQCFAVFVGVVANSSPEAVPRLMAYMISIIRATSKIPTSNLKGM